MKDLKNPRRRAMRLALQILLIVVILFVGVLFRQGSAPSATAGQPEASAHFTNTN